MRTETQTDTEYSCFISIERKIEKKKKMAVNKKVSTVFTHLHREFISLYICISPSDLINIKIGHNLYL